MKNTEMKAFYAPFLFVLTIVPMTLAAADDSRYELSGRLNLMGGTGEPTNDMLGYGFMLHRQLNNDWYLGVSVEHSSEFDVERPNELFGINSVSETDAVGSMTMLTAVAERRYAMESSNWTWFWNLGLGVADYDFDNGEGDIEGGGSFDIKVEADTETVLLGGIGLMQRLGENWSARYELGVEQHFADWKVTDEVSGATDSYDDFTVSGARLGLNYRF
jgi:opacity protein-like surface antigen